MTKKKKNDDMNRADWIAFACAIGIAVTVFGWAFHKELQKEQADIAAAFGR
jgi:hypothetical protein